MPRVMRGSDVPRPGRGRLEEGETSGVTFENDRNLRASTPNAMVLDLRVSGGWVYDGEGNRTWSLGVGRAVGDGWKLS